MEYMKLSKYNEPKSILFPFGSTVVSQLEALYMLMRNAWSSSLLYKYTRQNKNNAVTIVRGNIRR